MNQLINNIQRWAAQNIETHHGLALCTRDLRSILISLFEILINTPSHKLSKHSRLFCRVWWNDHSLANSQLPSTAKRVIYLIRPCAIYHVIWKSCQPISFWNWLWFLFINLGFHFMPTHPFNNSSWVAKMSCQFMP